MLYDLGSFPMYKAILRKCSVAMYTQWCNYRLNFTILPLFSLFSNFSKNKLLLDRVVLCFKNFDQLDLHLVLVFELITIYYILYRYRNPLFLSAALIFSFGYKCCT